MSANLQDTVGFECKALLYVVHPWAGSSDTGTAELDLELEGAGRGSSIGLGNPASNF